MEIERMFLLMLHVLCVVGAAIGIALADLSLFRTQRVDRALLRTGSRLVASALGLLWISGLLIIWIDTGFDLAVIAARPKLVAKVLVALLLTLNGHLLHRFFFKAVNRPPTHAGRAASGAAAMAAVSGASWLYAGFLGLAKPLATVIGLPGFATIFLAVLALCGLFVTRWVRPRVLQIYQRQSPG
ncbi:MAG: hypothetical protein EOP36_06135 [Rubrivivax sp.]|nr:MAG: hypothetical protein EOP36_06135 [Rubrivivax sp.]